MRRKAFVLSLAATASVPRFVAAQTLSVQDAIARLFTAGPLQPSWFTPAFLAFTPIERKQANVDGIVAALGPYRSIAPNRSRYTVTFARGTVQIEAKLDASGAIASLLYSRMQGPAATQSLTTFFKSNPVPATLFSDRFLAAIPIEKSRAVAAQLQAQFGPFVSATPVQDGSYDVEFANGAATAVIFLFGPADKIEGLLFQPH
ncbi:MAG TPA: hypothetical protein VGP41_15110 [Candidatus Lustribacter sp.]|jgi:hypothetical protein|nr:hypothetical protein [Candidatus Lustribacter sp.]